MAFPTTGILDPFTYSNCALATVSGGAWLSPVALDFNVDSNVIFPNVGAGAIVTWNALSLTNAEAYITITQLPASGEVAAMLWIDASGNGYGVRYTHGAPGVLISGELAAYAFSTLNSANVTLSAGDQIGMNLIISTNTIEGYTASGGTWTLRTTAVDSTSTSARRIGIAGTGTTVGMDNFGGGAPVAGGSPIGPLLQGKLTNGGILQGRLVR